MGGGVSSGIYFYQVVTDFDSFTGKMVLVTFCQGSNSMAGVDRYCKSRAREARNKKPLIVFGGPRWELF